MTDGIDPVTGRFVKGNKLAKGGGRPKGSPNKITATIKEAMTMAADNLGNGKGAAGVFELAGQKDIVAFANMLTRMMPLEVKAEVTGDVGICHVLQPVLIPRGCFLTKEQMKAIADNEPLEFVLGERFIEATRNEPTRNEPTPTPAPQRQRQRLMSRS